jgi:hypothetical protein
MWSLSPSGTLSYQLGLTLCGRNFFGTKPSLKAATGYIRLKCFHLRENNELMLIYPVAALGVILLGTISRTRKESQWNKMAHLTIVAFFFRICITNEKLDFLKQRITEIFSIWQVWWFFYLCDLDLLTLMLKVKFLGIKWKLTCLSITYPSFLLIQPQFNIWWFFLISEFMFFGPKKLITPWREVLFHRIYPVAARKGLKI